MTHLSRQVLRAAALTLLACLCLAIEQASAEGQRILSWDDCAAARDTLETFACGTDLGTHRLVVRFVAPPLPAPVREIDVTLDIWSGDVSGAIPDWWSFGACRPLSDLAVNAAPPAGCGTPMWTNMVALPLTSALLPPYQRITAKLAGDPVTTTVAGNEYFVMTLDIKNTHTVGAPTCGGCSVPVGIILRWLELKDDSGTTMDIPGSTPSSLAWVSWQCAGHAIPDLSYGYDGWIVEPGCSVPTRPSTWGRVKAMYR